VYLTSKATCQRLYTFDTFHNSTTSSVSNFTLDSYPHTINFPRKTMGKKFALYRRETARVCRPSTLGTQSICD
jgi:hypothetical protein